MEGHRDDRTDDLARRARDILAVVLGSRDPAVAATLHELALRCDAEGLDAEAASLWAEARALLQPVFRRRPLGDPVGHDEED